MGLNISNAEDRLQLCSSAINDNRCVVCTGDLHFYMRHSFQPAPPPEPAALPAPRSAAKGDVRGLLNPLADAAPAKALASKVAAAAAMLGCGGGGGKGVASGGKAGSASSVASSEADEVEMGRDIYQDLASFVNRGAILLHCCNYVCGLSCSLTRVSGRCHVATRSAAPPCSLLPRRWPCLGAQPGPSMMFAVGLCLAFVRRSMGVYTAALDSKRWSVRSASGKQPSGGR